MYVVRVLRIRQWMRVVKSVEHVKVRRRVGCKVFFFKQKTAYEIGVRLVGSEMCIRDSIGLQGYPPQYRQGRVRSRPWRGIP